MKSILGLLLCLVCLRASSAGSTGYLVDANCFRSEERNVNPEYIGAPGSRDLDFEVRACYPRANQTKAFLVVLWSGEILALDAAGNARASQLLTAAANRRARQDRLLVEITGTVSDDTIHVDSISVAR